MSLKQVSSIRILNFKEKSMNKAIVNLQGLHTHLITITYGNSESFSYLFEGSELFLKKNSTKTSIFQHFTSQKQTSWFTGLPRDSCDENKELNDSFRVTDSCRSNLTQKWVGNHYHLLWTRGCISNIMGFINKPCPLWYLIIDLDENR